MARTDAPGDSRPPPQQPGPSAGSEGEHLQAWELVERGRYRPLRIRGSFPGRELG